MSNSLWDLGRENEILRRISVPAKHCSLLGESVEARVDFCGGEDLGVVFQLALCGGGVEYA